jgi:hypothetical protein
MSRSRSGATTTASPRSVGQWSTGRFEGQQRDGFGDVALAAAGSTDQQHVFLGVDVLQGGELEHSALGIAVDSASVPRPSGAAVKRCIQ